MGSMTVVLVTGKAHKKPALGRVWWHGFSLGPSGLYGMPLAVLVALVGGGHFDQAAVGALVGDPAPLLPGHVGVVVGLATAGKLDALGGQLGQGTGDVVGGEAQVVNVLAHLLQAVAHGGARGGLDELDLGAAMVDEGGPLHAGVVAAGELVVADDGVFQLGGIQHLEDLGPVFNGFVEVFDYHAYVCKRAAGHISFS